MSAVERVARPVAEVSELVVGRRDGGPPTVDGVSLAVRPGEVVALVGPSGSGKTTTALTLLGFHAPGLCVRSGTVRVAGEDVLGAGVADRLRGATVAYLGQDSAAALNPARRIGSLLQEAVRGRLGRRPAGGRDMVQDEIARLLAAVWLPSDRAFLRRYGSEISGGQAQRVAFALVLAGDPRLLVLDEPTANLDPVLARDLRGMVAAVVGGRATVLVSHDHRLVHEVADRVIRLESGRVAAVGSPAEILPDQHVTGRLIVAPGAPAQSPDPVAVLRLPALAGPAVAAGPAAGPAGSGPRLQVAGLSAWHGGQPALRSVDLAPPPGALLAVVGPSGSGKSTLARCLVGLHRGRSTGQVRLDGVVLPARADRRSVPQCRAVQLVAQDSVGALNPRETVAAALARALPSRRRHPGERGPAAAERTRAEVERLLGLVQLRPAHTDRRPDQLSGGERARVNLARALACEPRVLVCDEVGASLDVDTGAAILDLLADLRRSSALTVLLVTHDLAVAASRSDRLAVLSDGAVVESGATGEVLAGPRHAVTRALLAAAG
ncbi:ATP-binding cassette domain-containing protein [Parafrankia sp. FMc6]|uniref:ABC transporter ATP-binding protein n=1 Tax=Parafrankia soli TaxID=2599596 RepID=UPI0034D40085